MTKRNIRTVQPPGFVVIDDDRFTLSIGGIRLIRGVDEREVELLAKAMSYKLHTYYFPMSGAKGGVDSDDIEDFYTFVNQPEIRAIISGEGNQQFITGPDIGTSEEHYREALKLAGLSELVRPGLLSKPSVKYGLPLDNIITAYGIVIVMEEIANQIGKSEADDRLYNKRISIEGFGKVGTGLAKLLKGRMEFVCISSRYGCIIDPKGLDMGKMLELQATHGDDFVNHSGYEVHKPEQLFAVDTDYLIPGARTEVITPKIAKLIVSDAKPTAIVPVANFPYSSKGLDILVQNDVLAFPDFIASAGAVIAAMIEFAEAGGEVETYILVEAAIKSETKLLFDQARKKDINALYQLATEMAETKKDELLKQSTKITDIVAIAKSLINRYAPKLL